MRRLSSAASVDGGREGLPAVVEKLLVDVVDDGFTLYCCGPKSAPNALVAAYEWEHCVDLLTIRDFDRITSARVPRYGVVDIFAPDVVVWAYEGPPQQTLRALLELVHPTHPDAPIAGYPAPVGLQVPRAQQRPMTIQPPSPGRAGTRAARLATAMRTPSVVTVPSRPPSPPGHQFPGGPLVESAAPAAEPDLPQPDPTRMIPATCSTPDNDEQRWMTARGHRLDGTSCTLQLVHHSSGAWTLYGLPYDMEYDTDGAGPGVRLSAAEITALCGSVLAELGMSQ